MAVVDGSASLTYSELETRIDDLARRLVALGLRAGDPVVACMRNRLEVVVAYLALQRIGAAYAPLNFRLNLSELQHCLDLVQPVAVLFDSETSASLAANLVLSSSHLLCLDFATPDEPLRLLAPPHSARSQAASIHDAQTVPQPQDVSLILFTSGTTGKPKGVARSHAAEVNATLINLAAFPWRLGERTLCVMPLHHTMGIRILLSSLFLGGTAVIQRKWSAEEALKLIRQHQLSTLFLVPTMYHDLLRSSLLTTRAVRSVQSIGFAGMVLREGMVSELDAFFRGKAMLNVYGCSELYCLSYSDNLREKPGTVGRGAFHQELRVIREAAGETTEFTQTEPGEVGQVIARADSPDAFQGYWNDPRTTAQVLRSGWYLTRDLAYRDADGDLFVVGRADDTIVIGGENVHPLEVEAALSRCPGLADVCVLGSPDERLGHVVAAFVVRADPSVTEEAILDYCATTGDLSPIKRPRRVIFVDEIPVSSAGKVRRHVLRDAYFPTRPDSHEIGSRRD